MNYFCFDLTTIYLEEIVMKEIKRIFPFEKLQYICVAQEYKSSTTDPVFYLHIQIILKEAINKKAWFLDSITGKLFSIHSISIKN